jgi:hypothetical protein
MMTVNFIFSVRFKVFTPMKIWIVILWVVMPCILVMINAVSEEHNPSFVSLELLCRLYRNIGNCLQGNTALQLRGPQSTSIKTHIMCITNLDTGSKSMLTSDQNGKFLCT